VISQIAKYVLGPSTLGTAGYLLVLACARERIWLTTAYFAPRQAFVDALCDAVRRGVDVRVLTNGPHTDREVVRQAGRRCYEQLLGCGGRIFEYQRTMLHAEVLLVDSHWVPSGRSTSTTARSRSTTSSTSPAATRAWSPNSKSTSWPTSRTPAS
jgi:phosphatidylserine/phosphatidylglycerophosphate/cardiolipin synthase-like enzyme